ncbi:217_t:CDS:2 [Ambispora gerdemannii]|uniref:217_t:CDS:1 n=1 Tax=Ambispora gerdemannii TaxID=144530 RepID=A0A9N9AII6_9GLOM|nr:217_t:CDS:2 [Ambispora gerdemannii]
MWLDDEREEKPRHNATSKLVGRHECERNVFYQDSTMQWLWKQKRA